MAIENGCKSTVLETARDCFVPPDQLKEAEAYSEILPPFYLAGLKVAQCGFSCVFLFQPPLKGAEIHFGVPAVAPGHVSCQLVGG